MKKKNGFTLAEVLITLGILGVVAALTLPTLSTNTGSQRNRAALKKGIATLNEAVKMNIANNGWGFSMITVESPTAASNNENVDHNPRNTRSIRALLSGNLTGETFLGQCLRGNTEDSAPNRYAFGNNDNVRIDAVFGSPEALIAYSLADGIIIGMDYEANSCFEDTVGTDVCVGLIDVNGFNGPNRMISCAGDTDPQNIWEDNYAECEVDRNTTADIFPIVFYGSTVELASNAGRAFFNENFR